MDKTAGENAGGTSRSTGSQAPLFALAVCGFSCLIGWELSAVFSPSLPLLSFCGIEEAIAVRCVSVLTLAAAFGLFAWRADWFYVQRDRLLAPALIVSLLPMAAALANSVAGGFPFAGLVVAWALLGVAQAVLSTYWCVFFSLAKSSLTMKTVISGGFGGTILFIIANATGELWVSMVEMGLMVVASMAIAFLLSRNLPQESIPRASEFHRVADLSVPAFLSVASCGAVYGFMTIEVCYQGPAAALVGGASGAFGCLLAFAWYRMGSRIDLDVGIVQRISLPLLVASLLMMPLFEGPVRIFWACVALAALAHNQMYTWFSVSIENYEFCLHPVRRFALRQTPSWIGFCVGCFLAFAAAFVLKLQGEGLYLLTGVFAIVLVVAFSVYGGDESKNKERLDSLIDAAAQTAVAVAGVDAASAEDAPADAAEQAGEGEGASGGESFYAGRFRTRCDEVAREFSLTPRESEVFALLAKGRNAEYIANQLVVTPATIKSHIYHIYQKLGVNSQQRLMDLMDEDA